MWSRTRPARILISAKRLSRWAVLAAPLILAGCGGRVSRPVAANEPYDSRLDCAHLMAEKAVNSARARDLTGERQNDGRDNMGLLLFSPLFLDLSDSEKVELEAFAAREKVLDGLIAQKCPAAGGGTS